MADKSVVCTQKLRVPKSTQFGTKMLTSHQKYQMELDSNVRLLSVKHPNEPCLKIKELLEELDNDVEMVEDLLQQQDHKAQTESKQKIIHVQQHVSPQAERKVLIKTIASLYAKLKTQQSQKKALQEENQNLKKEKEFYMNRSNLLSSNQFSTDFDRNLHIF